MPIELDSCRSALCRGDHWARRYDDARGDLIAYQYAAEAGRPLVTRFSAQIQADQRAAPLATLLAYVSFRQA